MVNEYSFAVICSENTWRTDLTIRYAEYWAFKIGGTVFHATSVDDALSRCKTKFLIVQFPGSIILNETFFSCLRPSDNLVLGNLIVEHDYVKLDRTLIFFNTILWSNAGRPKFNGSISVVKDLLISEGDRFAPKKIVLGENEFLVDQEAKSNGIEILIKQMELFGFANCIDQEHLFFLDHSTPFNEIHYESLFEHDHAKPSHIIYQSHQEYPNIKCDVLICSGEGTRAFNLARITQAKEIIVFDDNKNQLEFQKTLFSTNKHQLLKEMVNEDLKDQGYIPIYPTKYNIKFINLKITSFEAENLIRGIDHTKSLIIDFGEKFIEPWYYYKHPSYQMQALFAELFSLMKCRIGKTIALGYAPGFVDLSKVKINTSTYQYDGSIKDTYERVETEAITEELPSTLEPEQGALDDELVELAKLNGYTISISGKNFTASKIESVRSMDSIEHVYSYREDKWILQVGFTKSVKRIELFSGTDRDGFIKHLLLPVKFNPYSIKNLIKE